MSQTVILASGNITPFSHLTGSLAPLFPFCGLSKKDVLGPKLLLVMGCVKLGEKNCIHLPSVGEQTAN